MCEALLRQLVLKMRTTTAFFKFPQNWVKDPKTGINLHTGYHTNTLQDPTCTNPQQKSTMRASAEAGNNDLTLM